MAQETQREMELRLSKVIVDDEQVIQMMKFAAEHKITDRVNYMVHHWYHNQKKLNNDCSVREKFVNNMKHFIKYFEKCLDYMDSNTSKMVYHLQIRVSPFNNAYYWCEQLYPDGLNDDETIWTTRHMEWFARHMYINLENPRLLAVPLDSDSEEDPWNDSSDSEH